MTGFLAKLRQGSTPRILIAAGGLLGGVVLAFFVVPHAELPSGEETPPPHVDYLGSELPLQGSALEEALERTRRFSERSFTLDLPDGRKELLPLSALGASIDTTRLTRLVRDARDPTSAMSARLRRANEKTKKRPSLPVPVSVEVETALPVLMRVKDELDRAPADARLDLEKKSIVAHVTGQLLDIDATLQAIDGALAEGTLSAKAKVLAREPKRRAEELASIKFDAILGQFDTKYSRAEKAEDRTYNLRLAASKLDGTVLLPGEVFDFNEVVGPRDEANGYKVATVIADGELVDGIGGGTCQVSGTLHGAAFFAGLEILERYPHTRPSSYIKMGMDATVVYPTINFRVKNPFDFPVVLHQTVSGGTMRAEILGPDIDQVVTLIRRVDEALPYEQLERPDPKLPKGAKVLSQRGIPGFRLHRYRVVRRGSHTVREKWRDVYPPTHQVISIGTGPQNPEKKPQDDPAPEFLADELLVLTQRRAPGRGAGDFAENRVKGKYGDPGWTRAAGMPFWDK